MKQIFLKFFRLDLFYCLLLIFLILTFFYKAATLQGVFFGGDEIASDLLHFSYPAKEYWANDYLKKGQMLLWNPLLASGMPFVGQAENGSFNPINLLLFFFLPTPVAFNYLIITSFIFISIGTYFYAKIMGLSRISAFYCALIFTFSGFLIGHLRHVSVISSLAFMPFSFFLLEKILIEYRQKKIALTSHLVVLYLLFAVLTAFSILAGHLTTVYLVLMVLISYFSLRVYFKISKLNKHFWLLILSFFSSLFLSLLLSAVQLLPAWLLFLHSTRSNSNFDKSIAIVYQFKFLLLFLAPYIFGDPSKGTWPLIPEQNYWENIGYIGLLPLLLSLFGLFIGIKTKDIKAKIVGGIIFLSFLLLLGRNTFFFKLFWDFVPGFNLLRISGRFLLFIDFFLSLMAGFGLFYLEKKITYLKRPIICLIITLTIVDLFWFGIGFNNVISLDYFKPNQTSQFLDQDKSFFRIRSVNADILWRKAWSESKGWRDDLSAYFAHRQTLPADFNQLFRISSTDSIYGVSYHFSVRRSNELDSFIIESKRLLNKQPRLSLLLGMENVKYIILPGAYNQDPNLKLVKKISGNTLGFDVYIYENSLWLPRAYLVGKPIYVADDQQLLDQMFDKFEPSKEVLLSKKLDIPETSGKGEVTINHYDDDNVLISALSEDGGFLVLSDTYYPGWKAYIDGKETQIYKANYAYRAIYLTKGYHQVEFKYEPEYFRLGLIISVISLFLLIVSLTIIFLKKSKIFFRLK